MSALKLVSLAFLVGGALVSACTAQPAATAKPPLQSTSSIVVSSRPAPASTVSGPLDGLILHFNPAVRLVEVTLNGPNGLMPMMVNAAGESKHYMLPMPGLEAGQYTVKWRGMAQEHEQQGTFSFTVR